MCETQGNIHIKTGGGLIGMRIYHIRVDDTRDLSSITSSQIYNKDKHEKVKSSLFNKFVMELNTLLFDTVRKKIGHKLHVHM